MHHSQLSNKEALFHNFIYSSWICWEILENFIFAVPTLLLFALVYCEVYGKNKIKCFVVFAPKFLTQFFVQA